MSELSRKSRISGARGATTSPHAAGGDRAREDVDERVDFGFERVARGAKAGLVRTVFDRVARRYDLMNDLMSLGVHRFWKNALIDWMAPQPGRTYLDVAGGTGDIARKIADRVGAERFGPASRIVLCDINEAMLREGMRRLPPRKQRPRAPIRPVCGDAQALPLPDGCVDVYSIGFGIRNVTDIAQALGEAYRVLRPGGRFLCLEFSNVDLVGLDKLYERYSFDLVPLIGQVVAGDRQPYDYLVESIRRFPDAERFAGLIEAAGFERVAFRKLSGGIVALHSGWRL